MHVQLFLFVCLCISGIKARGGNNYSAELPPTGDNAIPTCYNGYQLYEEKNEQIIGCYKFFPELVPWRNASLKCIEEFGVLAYMRTKGEYEFLYKLALDPTGVNKEGVAFWSGGWNTNENGVWGATTEVIDQSLYTKLGNTVQNLAIPTATATNSRYKYLVGNYEASAKRTWGQIDQIAQLSASKPANFGYICRVEACNSSQYVNASSVYAWGSCVNIPPTPGPGFPLFVIAIIAGVCVLIAILYIVYIKIYHPSHYSHFKAFICCRPHEDSALPSIRRESMQQKDNGDPTTRRMSLLARRPSMSSQAELSLPPLDQQGGAPVQVWVKGPGGQMISLEATSGTSLEQLKMTMASKGFNENYKLVFEPKDKDDLPPATPKEAPSMANAMLVRRPSLVSTGEMALSPTQRKLSNPNNAPPHFIQPPTFGNLNRVTVGPASGSSSDDGSLPPQFANPPAFGSLTKISSPLGAPVFNRPQVGESPGGVPRALPMGRPGLPRALSNNGISPMRLPMQGVQTPPLMLQPGAQEVITIPVPVTTAPVDAGAAPVGSLVVSDSAA